MVGKWYIQGGKLYESTYPNKTKFSVHITLEIVIIFILVYNKNAYVETVKMVTEESMSQAVREANVKSNNHEVQHTSLYQ